MTDENRVQADIAWGLTGAGHYLSDCIDIITRCSKVDVFMSKAAKEVISMYHLTDKITLSQHTVFHDTNPSSPAVTKLYSGKYKMVVIAPTTSNTIAKMAYGIADNLVTNLFAHAGKCGIPTFILPCDSADLITSKTPKGEEVLVQVREIDRQNINRLAGWSGVFVMSSLQELKDQLRI